MRVVAALGSAVAKLPHIPALGYDIDFVGGTPIFANSGAAL